MNVQPLVRSKIRFLLPLSIGLVALLSLFVAMWAGLERLGVVAAIGSFGRIHGPLMILGFLGTVIALERAVGLGRWWGWISPMSAAIGAVALIAGSGIGDRNLGHAGCLGDADWSYMGPR